MDEPETQTIAPPPGEGADDGPQVLAAAPAADAIAPAEFIYAIGRITPGFPSISVEKEYLQVRGRTDTAGATDRQAMHAILSDRANRYLVRQLCWVFAIEGLETYILAPRELGDLDLLIETIRSEPGATDVDVVVGVLGPVAPPEVCNALMLPIVAVDQLYSFDRDELVDAVPRPDSIGDDDEAAFRSAAGELFDRIMQMADNAGMTDGHRALNYLAMRYPAIYEQTAHAHVANASLTAVDAQPSRLSGARRIVDVIFAYTDRRTDVTEKFFVRVDVTDQFPFLVTKLSAYYDRI
jgi:hypothetical protein